jgi:hypothetical protein
MPIEAHDRSVVADFTIARLGDRPGDVPHEFGRRELLVVREQRGQPAIAELPLTSLVGLSVISSVSSSNLSPVAG